MASLITTKLYSTIMEQKISAWVENRSEQAFGEASFRPKHCIKSIYGKNIGYTTKHSKP